MVKLLELLQHPDEMLPIVQMLLKTRRAKRSYQDPGLAFCYGMLQRVSRSFSVVIQQLPEELRNSICVFYLILRALDTVEDDMNLPNKQKIPLLRTFHEHLFDRTWRLKCGYGPYVDLMENYPLVTDVFLTLSPGTQEVIRDSTKRMGNGMADFIGKKEVSTVAEYDLYCHYVAGLVGSAVARIFVDSGLEKKDLIAEVDLANNMGQFLQKTNVIRDYHEDICEEPAPRMFWPREIWGQYAKELTDFKDPANEKAAVRCLNHMVTDALRHCEIGLNVIPLLENIGILRSCLIPEVMGLRTLTLCYNNPQVFRGVVKMRRGETAKLFMSINDKRSFYETYLRLANELEAKCKGEASGDPMVATTLKHVHGIQKACKTALGIKEPLVTPKLSLTDDNGMRLVGMVAVVTCVKSVVDRYLYPGSGDATYAELLLDYLSEKGLVVRGVFVVLLLLLASWCLSSTASRWRTQTAN
uniref:Ayame triterpene biosynthesis protein 3 n=1 Tax=Botryococcus braunii TaxID=38881 RepID=A0A172QBW1_BOTBR|nr:ayame triterpene biosynthesis protein 3 [Botryococcus braunii]